MRFKPTEDGPSVFGRTIAAEIFGSEKNCMLAKERIGVKVNRRNSRGPCDAGLEELFVECVTRNYSDDTDEAVSRAVAGANQYGAEMKQKHSLWWSSPKHCPTFNIANFIASYIFLICVPFFGKSIFGAIRCFVLPLNFDVCIDCCNCCWYLSFLHAFHPWAVLTKFNSTFRSICFFIAIKWEPVCLFDLYYKKQCLTI